jgi:hypothetical protein
LRVIVIKYKKGKNRVVPAGSNETVVKTERLDRYQIKGDFKQGFVIFAGLLHVLVVGIVTPSYDNLVAGLIHVFHLPEKVQQTLGGAGVEILELELEVRFGIRILGILIHPVEYFPVEAYRILWNRTAGQLKDVYVRV